MTVIFSRRDAQVFTPEGSPRAYTIAPLTYRERQAFRAELAAAGGVYPSREQLMQALRAALQALQPGNLPELLEVLDTAEALGDAPATEAERAVLARLAAVEAICANVGDYAALLAARQRWSGMLPWVAARHALRGWEGPGLPPFQRERGLVPAELLDLLPDEDLQAVGWRASEMMQPGQSAEGNFVPPSPSPASPPPSPEG